MELFKAHSQWANRPNDERFWGLDDALAATNQYAKQAAEKEVAYGELRVEAIDGDVCLVGRRGLPAGISHYAFGQLARTASCPASFLRKLPATLAAQNLNWGLKHRAEEVGVTVDEDGNTVPDNARLLFHREDERLLLRAATTDSYVRIWTWEVLEDLRRISQEAGWRVPPARPVRNDPRARPATEADVLERSRFMGLGVKVGDMIAPAGVYVSDHDFFVFLVDEKHPIDAGGGRTLNRGAFFWGSEVGHTSQGAMRFLYDGICGNHIVWGAQGVQEIRIPHIGKARQRWDSLSAELGSYANGAASQEEARILAARTKEFGKDREEVVDAVFGLARSKRISLGEKLIGEAFDVAEKNVESYGSPRALWGIVNGLTELSQRRGYAEERVEIDRAAGKLLAVADF